MQLPKFLWRHETPCSHTVPKERRKHEDNFFMAVRGAVGDHR